MPGMDSMQSNKSASREEYRRGGEKVSRNLNLRGRENRRSEISRKDIRRVAARGGQSSGRSMS